MKEYSIILVFKENIMHEGMGWFGLGVGHWGWGLLMWGAIILVVYALVKGVSKKK